MDLWKHLRKINKPIVFFDIETTSLDTNTAKIIEIGILKYTATEVNDYLKAEIIAEKINPEIEILPEITKLTGITNEILKDKPIFKDRAEVIYKILTEDEPIIAGYNHVRFDMPILARALAECGYEFPLPGTKYYDVLKIFRKKFSMNLENAYKYFVSDNGFEGAHNALSDTQATADIFQKQLEKYSDLAEENIHDFCGFNNMIDFAGKLKRDEEGFVLYNFGKHMGKKVLDYPDYANWMLQNDFPKDTKNQLRTILKQKQ